MQTKETYNRWATSHAHDVRIRAEGRSPRHSLDRATSAIEDWSAKAQRYANEKNVPYIIETWDDGWNFVIQIEPAA